MSKSIFIPYGFVKIQKLPISLWDELKIVENESDFITYLNNHWDTLELLICSKDTYGVRVKSHLNWSSIKHIYGILTSKILRGGGSKLTSWSLWCYTEENTIKFDKLDNTDCLPLKLPNRIDFKLSPIILRIGGDYFSQLKESSTLIHNSVLANIDDLIQRYDLTSLERNRLCIKTCIKTKPV